jgi:hypothetical protein
VSAGGRSAPIPGQKIVEAAGGIPVGHAFKHVGEVGKRLNVVELDQGPARVCHPRRKPDILAWQMRR